MRFPDWYIYVLIDPRYKCFRYVGQTNNPQNRLKGHLRDAKAGDRSRRSCWIRRLLFRGLRPTMQIVQSGSGPGVNTAEKSWIKFYRERVGRRGLLNLTCGGAPYPDVAALLGLDNEAEKGLSVTLYDLVEMLGQALERAREVAEFEPAEIPIENHPHSGNATGNIEHI